MVAHGRNASLTSVAPSYLLENAGLTVVEAFTSFSLSFAFSMQDIEGVDLPTLTVLDVE